MNGRRQNRLNARWFHRQTARLLILILLLLVAAPAAGAQDGEEAETQPSRPSRLFIAASDAASLPEIELRVFALDGLGQPLNLAIEPIAVTHGGQPAETVEVIGTHPAGTFTVFIIDVPPGVSEEIPGIQAAIEQYARPDTMVEQVDAIAIYRVGHTTGEQLLGPSDFHNSVRNLFINPIDTQIGLTALYDSVMGLLNDMNTLKPRPDMLVHVVVMTDGTDAISSQASADDVPARAAALGIPIHTIWLDNENLSDLGKETGQNYLRQVAETTGGIATTADKPEEIAAIWPRIASFRDQAVIHYTVAELTGGSFPVNVSLANDPAASATTTIDIPPAAPMIAIDLSAGSRSLTLPSLPTSEAPLRLSIPTTLRWLDGVEREARRAQLLVNNVVVQEIEPAQLAKFNADIPNFIYGINSMRVVMLDDAGGRAASPIILLTVREGPQAIPDELRPSRINLPSLRLPTITTGPWLACLLGLVLLVLVFGGLTWWFRIRIPGLDRLRRRDRGRRLPPGVNYEPAQPAYRPSAEFATSLEPELSLPYLEALQAQTPLPARMILEGVEVRLGRSPMQADIVFEDDATVSRLHASIVRDGYEYRLYDERSTSGTLVNGIPVPPQGVALIDGDEIHLGAVHLRFNHH